MKDVMKRGQPLEILTHLTQSLTARSRSEQPLQPPSQEPEHQSSHPSISGMQGEKSQPATWPAVLLAHWLPNKSFAIALLSNPVSTH